MRPLLLLAALALVVGATAVATSSGARGGSSDEARPAGPAERRLAERAQHLVDLDPGRLGLRLRVTGPRPGVRASVDLARRTVSLHVRPGPAHRVAHDLAHELGHVVDHDQLDDRARRSWLQLRGAPAGTSWWPGEDSDYATGAGDFAEVHAACHAAGPEFRSQVAARPPDPCGLLRRFTEERR